MKFAFFTTTPHIKVTDICIDAISTARQTGHPRLHNYILNLFIEKYFPHYNPVYQGDRDVH